MQASFPRCANRATWCRHVVLVAVCILIYSPTLARPPGPADAVGLIAKSDLIVVGRVEDTQFPEGLPGAANESTLFTEDIKVRVDRILMGGSLPSSRVIDIHLVTFKLLGHGQYGLFFIKTAPDGSFSIVDPDNPFLPANPAASKREPLSPDPLSAVALELIDVIATPREILTDPDRGVMFWPSAGPAEEAEMIYATTIEALRQVPSNIGRDQLRQAASSGALLNRLWASSILLRFDDTSTLPQIAPALMTPAPYTYRAAGAVGSALNSIKYADELPTLVSLLQSDFEPVRAGATAALRGLHTPESIRPLAQLLQREQDVHVSEQAMWGLCEATHTKSELCGQNIWKGSDPNIRAAWREWAKTFLANGRE